MKIKHVPHDLSPEQENRSPLQSMQDAIRSLSKTKVTNQEINELIYKAECIVFPGTEVNVCCLTLHNGTHVFGFGSDIHPEHVEDDKALAIENARNRLWNLYGNSLNDVKMLKMEAQHGNKSVDRTGSNMEPAPDSPGGIPEDSSES